MKAHQLSTRGAHCPPKHGINIPHVFIHTRPPSIFPTVCPQHGTERREARVGFQEVQTRGGDVTPCWMGLLEDGVVGEGAGAGWRTGRRGEAGEGEEGRVVVQEDVLRLCEQRCLSAECQRKG